MQLALTKRIGWHYTDKTLSEQQLEKLLKAAMAVSSTDDQRPWHFVVIKDKKVLDQMPLICHHAFVDSHLTMAILICGDLNRQKVQGSWVHDCAAAAQNILTEAQRQKLMAVWLTVHPILGRIEHMRKALGIPDHIVPFALIPVGHSTEHLKPKERYDASRIHYDHW